MWGYVAAASVEPPETPTWTPCPDCGAPMEDDDETSWPYCPICLDGEYTW